jgi:class 3 adenylate cyclase/tetratricopeptide (TPR) repeat protein
MRCVTCGVELIEGKKFCHACGAPVGMRCRGCAAPLESSFRFCPDCGLKVEIDEHEAPPPAAADPLARALARRTAAPGQEVVPTPSLIEGERKQVTVFFCDLVGSVSIAERLDPEEYHDLLEDYLDIVFPEIYRREGVVNVLAGDGVMALFGAPVAHEDSPERAVKAALAVREALEPLSARLQAAHGIPLQVRIGINTGPVVVGPVGNDRKMDYTAIGDTTNLASRLQTLAPPGAILISESTHRLVRGFFAVEPVGPLGVRGKSEPVTAYAVTEWLGGATSKFALAEERGLTPFVGREAELSRMVDAFARLADGQTHAVAIIGDAGSGKSRLLYEFRRRLAGSNAAFFEGRCSSMMQALPYHPFMAMMARWFDLDWDEPTEEACAKVAAKFGSVYDDVERTYPLLCRFLSLPIEHLAEMPADELRRETFDAIARLVLSEARERPVVMIVEDRHWIDEPSCEMLDDLVRRLAGAPVLIVVTHRPGAVPWQVSTTLTQVALRPLDDSDVVAVVRAVAGGALPGELERVVVSRAGGSPYFAEELVRSLIEEGHLKPTPAGELALTRPLGELPIPSTIQEVIAARLDALGASAKRVVQVAAVLGRQFRSRQLGALLSGDGIDVEHELAELERRGLVHRKSALSSDEFRFGESLTQEVAYEGLLLKQRRQLHERIGGLLESEPAERGLEHAALLAHHYARSDDQAKAVEALLGAARAAGQVPSYRIAAEYFRQAWQLAETALAEREDGSLHRAALEAAHGLARLEVFFGVADIDVAERAAVRGRELAELLGDRQSLAAITYLHGILTIMRPAPDFAGGLALAERGVALAEAEGLHDLARGLSRGLCTNYAADGRFALARERIERGIAELEAAGHRDRMSDIYLSALWVRALVLYAQDEFDLVLESATMSFALAERANNRTLRSALGNLLAPVHYLRGEYAEAKRWADVTLEIGEAIANENAYTTGAAVALLAHLRLGDAVDPRAYVERIETGLRAGGTMQLNTRFVGEALLEAGEVERADRLTAELVARTGGRLRQAMVLTARGDVLAHLGRLDEAADRYAEAIALADAIGARSTLAVALLGAAEVAAAQGATPSGLERAAALCDELGMHHYRSRLARLHPAGGLAAADSRA